MKTLLALPWLPPVALTIGFIVAVSRGGATVGAIPTLDDMAGDWCPVEKVLNPPAMDNRQDMIQVRYDLISSRYNPGDSMMPQTATGVPFPILRISGREYTAQSMRWTAFELRRRNSDCDGFEVESAVRLLPEEQGFLTRIVINNPSRGARTVPVEIIIPQGTVLAETADGNGPTAINTTLRRGFVSAFAAARIPDESSSGANGVVWRWELAVPAGGKAILEYAVVSKNAGASVVAASARALAKTFAASYDEPRRWWEQRWAEAFTPGNGHFSGHLPVFETEDEALRRIYYMSVLTVLDCERSQFKISPRDFLTEPDRPGKQYFWDASMMATVWALLEPQGMKSSLRYWLGCDLLNSHGLNISNAKDMSPGGYSFSPANVLYTTLTYIGVAGDERFLDEVLAPDGKTVLQRLDEIALLWKQRVKPGQVLGDWGRGNNLLEGGAPTYVGSVASLNAQSVGLMREVARWHALKGNAKRAAQLREEVDKLLPAVLSLYRPGEGVWNSVRGDGARDEQRHCVDFIYVSQAIATDLTESMRREMLGFVRNELLMKNWMRAMSLKDPGARKSVRPDHGPMGSYDGWIPLMVAAMCRLGSWSDAVMFLRRTELATREGPYAQAREFSGINRMSYDAPICVATGPTIGPFEQWTPSRGEKSGAFSSKECISGGAFADAIIGTLFGFQPDLQGGMLVSSDIGRPFVGTLRGLRYRGKLYDVTAGKSGVRIEKPSR